MDVTALGDFKQMLLSRHLQSEASLRIEDTTAVLGVAGDEFFPNSATVTIF